MAAVFARHSPLGDSDFVLCVFRRTTGVACPGCGLTRAFLALLRGDLASALVFHPLAPFLTLQALVVWLLWGGTVLGLLGRAGRAWDRWALANAAALMVVWVARLASGTLPG